MTACVSPKDLFARTDNLEQEEEDLNDVDVDVKCGKHVFLRTDGVLPVTEEELRVVGQELRSKHKPFPDCHAFDFFFFWEGWGGGGGWSS